MISSELSPSKDSPKPVLLYVITRANIGGAQRHVESLIGTLSGEYEIVLVCGEEGNLTERVSGLARIVILTHLKRGIDPLSDIICVLKLREVIRSVRPKLVHAHSSKAGALTRLAAIGVGVPVVFTVHGWPFSKGNPPVKRFLTALVELLLAPLTTRIIAVSEYDARIARKVGIHKFANINVIHNGIEPLSDMADITPNFSRITRLCFVGRLSAQKNVSLLLRSVALLKKPYCLKIVGDGEDRDKLTSLASSLGIAKNVIFNGETDNIESVLSCADVFVLTSKWEGLPLSIIEAMRARLPVVTTDVGGVGELVGDQDNGFLCPVDNPEFIASRLAELCGNKALRVKMGEAGLTRFNSGFTEKIMINSLRNIYGSLIN